MTLLLSSLFTGIVTASDTGPLEEQWNLTFNEKDGDYGASVIGSNSGAYIVAGSKGLSAISTDYDAFLYEIDKDGNLVWSKDFGGDQQDQFSKVIDIGEDGYIAIGETISFSSGTRSAWMVKVDNNGNELWNKTIEPSSSIILSSGQKTSDGNLILAGMRAPPITASGNLVAVIIKTDPEGNILWSKDFGLGTVRTFDYFDSVKETPEGDFIMAGTTRSFSSGNVEDGWLVKVDPNGNELWNRSFGDFDLDFLSSVTVSKDGGYIAVGSSRPYGAALFNAWAVKTDSEGNLLWEQRYFEGFDSSFYSIMQTSDGNYIVSGSMGSIPNGSVEATFSVDGYDGVLLKINENGDKLWSQTFDSYYSSSFNSIAGSDGNYVTAGATVIDDGDTYDTLVVRFNDPTIEGQISSEDDSSDKSNEEDSPLSFLVTLVCLGSAFIYAKKE